MKPARFVCVPVRTTAISCESCSRVGEKPMSKSISRSSSDLGTGIAQHTQPVWSIAQFE